MGDSRGSGKKSTQYHIYDRNNGSLTAGHTSVRKPGIPDPKLDQEPKQKQEESGVHRTARDLNGVDIIWVICPVLCSLEAG